jgi:hypothetical protein
MMSVCPSSDQLRITRQGFQQKVDKELVENARTDSNFVDKTKA